MRDRDGRGSGGRYSNGNNRGGRGRRGRQQNRNNSRRSGGGRPYRRGGGNSRDPRAAAHSGNKRERIAIESGHLVLIDQFMLANPQFAQKLQDTFDDAPEAKDGLIQQYGGTVVELTPGTYRIERDPYAFTIVIHPDGQQFDKEEISDAGNSCGHVYVDTRCLAMVDRELLDDSALLEKYQQLWFSGQEKACRDLLRDNGGAVRYGFQRFGDELGVHQLPDADVVCLWPDINQQEEVDASAVA